MNNSSPPPNEPYVERIEWHQGINYELVEKAGLKRTCLKCINFAGMYSRRHEHGGPDAIFSNGTLLWDDSIMGNELWVRFREDNYDST